MVEDSYKASYVPDPQHIRRFSERSNELARTCQNEKAWYNAIIAEALNLLFNGEFPEFMTENV
jgi:hypothetical protein